MSVKGKGLLGHVFAGSDFSDIYNMKGFTVAAYIISWTRMKRKSKLALAAVILAVVVIVSVVYILPYLTPESILVTLQKGFVGSYPSIGFDVTGHLFTRDADLPMNYSIFVNGSLLTGGYSMYAGTDFLGDFEFATGQTAMTATPFQTGDTIEMKIIVNENGKIITQDFDMTY